MRRQIEKAVFPVAGLGTRFLPATKASPKEMLPVVDKPLIQYAVEEAAEAGIKTLIFITGRTKRAIEDHFDKVYELETELEERGKSGLLKVVEDTTPKGINCVFIRQREALGLGHAVLSARPVVGEQPFAVILADDLIAGRTCGVMKQMIEQFQRYQCSMLGVERVPREETKKYGIVKTLPFTKQLSNVDGIVEKPRPEEAPSNLAVSVVTSLHREYSSCWIGPRQAPEAKYNSPTP